MLFKIMMKMLLFLFREITLSEELSVLRIIINEANVRK